MSEAFLCLAIPNWTLTTFSILILYIVTPCSTHFYLNHWLPDWTRQFIPVYFDHCSAPFVGCTVPPWNTPNPIGPQLLSRLSKPKQRIAASGYVRRRSHLPSASHLKLIQPGFYASQQFSHKLFSSCSPNIVLRMNFEGKPCLKFLQYVLISRLSTLFLPDVESIQLYCLNLVVLSSCTQISHTKSPNIMAKLMHETHT